MLRNLKQFNLPEIEERVLQFWRTNDIFKKSLRKRSGRKTFVFYEGPPTANAKPALHHVLARSFKDVILRYKTMGGYFVPRRGGWDTHGLPVELQVEKALGISSKKEIEHIVPDSVEESIKAFNKKCRDSVWEFTKDWRQLTERIAFWLDMDNPYITYEPDYIESLWWIIKQAWEKDLFYKGHKVVPWCPRCGTALSSHELAQGYKEVEERSVYVRFRIVPEQRIGAITVDEDTYILSWTTTPWTLPGNVALAVAKDTDYAIASVSYDTGDVTYILAQPLSDSVLSELVEGREWRVTGTIKGSDLIGLRYQQLFDILSLRNEKSHRIYAADFVTTHEGTGVVHTAVMYGDDDYQLGKEIGLPQIHTVDEAGRFIDEVPEVAGMFVKEQRAEDAIIHHLRESGALAGTKQYRHEYPFCWRCSTPLIYYARNSWFMAMSKLRESLVAENEKTNWHPAHIQHGRFGEWIKDAKDWAFSRERYWGTPLPIWECANGHTEVIGSVDELDKRAYSKNTFYIARHVEAEGNVNGVFASGPEFDDEHTSRLTEHGLKQAHSLAKKMARKKIDVIYASPYTRTRQLAEIVQKETGAKLFFDERLKEIEGGEFAWRPASEHKAFFTAPLEEFTKAPEGGETLADVRRRMFAAIRDINTRHADSRILIVSHGDPLWMLEAAVQERSNEEALQLSYIGLGETRKLVVRNIPYNDDGERDLHRPYVDAIMLKCAKCKEKMRRVSEVADVWFDSGAMPFASVHYPFKRSLFRRGGGEKFLFPADYICEAIDQTRGWFYTLLATAVLLGRGRAFRNVISLGHINDKFGQKMSKSKGNIVDPWEMIQKYGSDAIRWHFYTINAPGEPKNFDEEELAKTLRRVVLILYNSFAFLETYGDKKERDVSRFDGGHILDKWIRARFDDVAERVGTHMERYEITEAARVIEEYIDDLSRWYIRRSRKRFSQKDDPHARDSAIKALSFALLGASKLMAPFMPLFSEALYRSLPVLGREESVHLEEWPRSRGINKEQKELLGKMSSARVIVAAGLAARAAAGIKVRQPLQSLMVRADTAGIANADEVLGVIKDEVNVKEIIFNPSLVDEVALDTTLTPALREEGVIREFIRTVQMLRQKAGYHPNDSIVLTADVPQQLREIVEARTGMICGEIGAREIRIRSHGAGKDIFDAEIDTKIHSWDVWLGTQKVRSNN